MNLTAGQRSQLPRTRRAIRRIAAATTLTCRSEVSYAVGVSLIWLLFYNHRFWSQTLASMWNVSGHATLFLASLFLLALTLQSMLLLLVPTRVLMRATASALFLIAAASAYFSSVFGAVMNQDMMRNLVETDPDEIRGLLNLSFAWHIALLGVAPAVLAWRVRIAPRKPSAQLRRRATYVLVALTACGAGALASSADFAVFLRAHKPIRYLLTPAAPIASTAGMLLHGSGNASGSLLNPAGRSQRVGAPGKHPLALFLVVGETARAANFSLGGYVRTTNPKLQGIQDLVYFDYVTACGTSTAVSVPCMFSSRPRADFEVDAAKYSANLLDALLDAGVDVEWRDNNAGCKGVCARVRTHTYADRSDPIQCTGQHCYDHVMLAGLDTQLKQLVHDTVFVFHQIGSHGPAYFERYPPSAERFAPACRTNQLQSCTRAEVINAYDNSIAATDDFLAQQIGLLRQNASHVDGALLYVSDHGESLGEQGLYLHGMPYAFAPRTQKEVPMLLWTSSEFRDREKLDLTCIQQHASDALSHDNLYHTVLAATQTHNRAYDAALDVLAPCRGRLPGGDHE